MFIYVYMYIQLHCKPKFISSIGLSWFKMATWVDQDCFLSICHTQCEQKLTTRLHLPTCNIQLAGGNRLAATWTQNSRYNQPCFIFLQLLWWWPGINYTIQQNDIESTYKKTFLHFFFKCKDVNSLQSVNGKIRTLLSDPWEKKIKWH